MYIYIIYIYIYIYKSRIGDTVKSVLLKKEPSHQE